MNPLELLKESWSIKHGGVTVEREGVTPGWAVYSGCEGESPRFVAFFAGADALDLADAMVAATGDAALCDGSRTPAIMTTAHGLVIANDFRDADGIAVLCELFGRKPGEWVTT